MLIRNLTLAFLYIITGPALLSAQNDSTSGGPNLLSLSLEQLMNVKVVTASGYPQTISEAPSTITVISKQQIEERGYEQLEDALRDVPGIDMIHVNGYAPTLIYFRGMYGAENLRALLMIDGIVENNIIGSNDLAGPAYPMNNVERIEIIWGPVSALYGENAFGGVIHIITKKGNEVNGVHAEGGFGSFNTSFERINIGERKSNLEYAISGSLYSTDGPRFTNRDPQYSASYVDKAYSLNGKISYYTDKTKTTFGYRNYRTPMGFGTYSNSPSLYLGLPTQGYDNKGILGVLQRNLDGQKPNLDDAYLRTYFIEEEYKPSDKLNFLARAVYRETGTADDSYIYITIDGKRLIHAAIATSSNRSLGQFSANYSPSEKQKFSAGLEFYQDNVEQGSRRETIDTTLYVFNGRDTVTNLNSTFLPRLFNIRNNFGSYLQYIQKAKWLGETDFTLGARYDRNSYFGDALSPRAAIVNQPNKQFTFKIQFGTAFRAPTNLEIYQTPGGNFTIKKEKIKTYEVNGIYAASENLRFQLNGFRNELTDVVVLANLSGLNPNKNPGTITINGCEAVADLILARNISGFLNFTYQDATGQNLITHVKRESSGVAKVKGNAGITFHLNQLLIISLSENWVGTRQSPSTDPYGPVKGYFLSNCVISTEKLFKSGVSASVNIHNLFNTKWLDPGFRTADGLVYSTVLEQPGASGIFKIAVAL
ncbi:MAG TPA: TonB-dependent receptor [Puia sp.]|nr:TonB-dependent receptor [Puia sp.]